VKLKDRASFFLIFLEKLLNEVYLVKIKEQVGEYGRSRYTHRYAINMLPINSNNDLPNTTQKTKD